MRDSPSGLTSVPGREIEILSVTSTNLQLTVCAGLNNRGWQPRPNGRGFSLPQWPVKLLRLHRLFVMRRLHYQHVSTQLDLLVTPINQSPPLR